LCVKEGIRASFLANFTDDGVNFTPAPVKTRTELSKRPAPQQKPPITLDWYPVKTDASNAGDIGYNTGPYTLTDDNGKEPPQYGQFFSIWKKQSDGAWKVVLDFGTQSAPKPEAAQKSIVPSASKFKLKGTFDPLKEADGLKAAEQQLSAMAKEKGLAAAYAATLAPDAWLLRSGIAPLTDASAIRKRAESEQEKGVTAWSPTYAEAARSADLGYTYGSYATETARSTVQKGYFTHVWKRNENGEWKLVLDVANELPPEKQ